MKNYLSLKKISFLCVFIFFLASCSKDNSSTDPAPNKDPDVVVSLEDTITRKWIVEDATHNGTADGSSTGLILDIRNDGSYTLVSTNYIGTWEFMDNKTKVLLDKDGSNIKTTWTIVEINSNSLIVDFKSPFTGGNAHWEMIPF
ncbi:MAG: hypothetical protein R2852_09595 [Bacteroidia bacterium]